MQADTNVTIDGYYTLPSGESFDTISEACRTAALAFMRGVSNGWTKRDLARWLAGPYAAATRHVRAQPDRTSRPKFRQGGLSEELVAEWISGARYYATMLLKQLEQGIEPGYVDDAVVQGYIASAVDELGMSVWVPVEVRDMRLKDRVRALFVADYLNCPGDYARLLYVCPRCVEPTFDELAKRLGVCAFDENESGVQLQSGEHEHNESHEAAPLRPSGTFG